LKKNLYITFFLFTFILLFSGKVSANNTVPSHSRRFLINDFAGILSPKTENRLFNIGKQLELNGGSQVILTTISSLDGKNIEEYAFQFIQNWNVKELFILFSLEEQALYIAVHPTLQNIITNSMIHTLINLTTEHLENKDFDTALANTYTLTINELQQPGNFSVPNANLSFTVNLFILLFILGGILSLNLSTHPSRLST